MAMSVTEQVPQQAMAKSGTFAYTWAIKVYRKCLAIVLVGAVLHAPGIYLYMALL